MSHQSTLMKNTAIIAIGKLSTQIISYLLLPLYTAKMTKAEYGNYDFVCTLSLFICPIITLLMEESMFRFLIDANSEERKKKVITQTIIYALFGTLVFIPVATLIFNVATEYSGFYIFTIITFIISNVAIALSNALARGLSKIKLYSFSNFILGAFTIILTLIIIIWHPSAEGLLWANAIANIVTAFIVFYKLKLKKYIGKIDKKLMPEMIKYSVPLVPNSISWTIINMSDRIILTQMIGADANGIYAMANKFPNIINVLYGYFYTAWKESAAKILKDENREKFYSKIYIDMKKIMYAVTICLIALMPFAFPIFINSSYDEAYIYIPIIMIATYFSCLSSFYGGIFTAYKNTKIMGSTTMIAAAINLVVDLVFVMQFKIYAACFSTLIADLIIYFYRKIKLKDYIRLREVKWQGPLLILAIICFAYYLKYIPGCSMTLYWIANVFTAFIAIAYSIMNNKKILKKLVNKFRRRSE